MTVRQNANHFLRSNPRTAGAMDRFIGGIGARRRQSSERHAAYIKELNDGTFAGGIKRVLDYSDSPIDPFAVELEPERIFGRKHSTKTWQKKPGQQLSGSGKIGTGGIRHTLHEQALVTLDTEEKIVTGQVCPIQHKNKMAGMTSINVTTGNAFCTEMRERADEREKLRRDMILAGRNPDAEGFPSFICVGCYANKLLESRDDTVRAAFKENEDLLTSRIVPFDQLPKYVPGQVVRFHAFGDVINDTHLANIFNIINANPQAYFTIWTKNWTPFHDYIVRYGRGRKPTNLVVIASNNALDTIDIDSLLHPPKSEYVNGTFNVVRTKDPFALVYGDIKNFGRYYPNADPNTPITYGYNAELDLTFVHCDDYCINCRQCYSGLHRFVVIEKYRKTRGDDPYKIKNKKIKVIKVSERGHPPRNIAMQVMSFRIAGFVPQRRRSARATAIPPRRAPSQTQPRRQEANRHRMPTSRYTRR